MEGGGENEDARRAIYEPRSPKFLHGFLIGQERLLCEDVGNTGVGVHVLRWCWRGVPEHLGWLLL
ncbi:hypothetical protein QJS10_CPA07g00093 [Acorus calamus]|uniref:Uncharacterized protein n=1 Tax=Acorus calamus TaxID=4465 RepID=A0AAV9EGK8_ACOCL|nr:hypothetical protein QJS10_CPA07g00093 [Acorus calamus]